MSGKSTAVSFVLALILWILGVLTFLFNYLGLWVEWHLAGFAFVFYLIIPAIAHLVALGKSLGKGGQFFFNLLTTAVSVIMTLFTVHISAGWFW